VILAGEAIEPAFGQTERLVDDAELTLGGSGCIVACGAARLGLRTAMISVVGDDAMGRFMTEALDQRGGDTRGIRIDPDRRTGLTVILDRGEDRAILTFPGTIADLDPSEIDGALLTSSRHLHVSSFFLQRSLAAGLPDLFSQVADAGATTSVDPNWDPDEQWDGGLKALLPQIDVFLPNRQEAMRVAGRQDAASAARQLAHRGSLVAVKLGADGALAVRRDGELIEVPAIAGLEPVDTVGAGDSFDAGVLAGLLQGWGTRRALELGCACGALSARGRGGTAAQPNLEEALSAFGEAV
jgi:sugar/nucleoside kinase (ribokinase family)